MKKLLVPTNFTTTSENALYYAEALVKKQNAKITLLHASPIVTYRSILSKKYIEKIDLFRHESENKLKKLCEKVENSSVSQCDYINSEGMVEDTITHYAKKINPDLLVIGTEDLNYFDRALFGTITGNVIKKANCTLLVVPENISFKAPKKVAFAIDYHDTDIEEIFFLIELTREFSPEIHILRIVTDDENMNLEINFFEDFKEEIEVTFPDQKFIFQFIHGNNIVKELRKFISKEEVDLLAVAKSKKNQLERFLSGSVSQKLFNHLSIPLLIFQAEDKPNDFF